MKKALISILCLFMMICTGCGKSEQLPEPTVEPEVTATPEPELPAGDPVILDGVLLESGSVLDDGVQLVRFLEMAEVLGIEPKPIDETHTGFVWRGKDVEIKLRSLLITVDGETRGLEKSARLYRGELYVPVKSVCKALDISMMSDGESPVLYCTPGAGHWQIPEGIKVPVLMYHGVSAEPWGVRELFVDPAEMEAQLEYLVENGYDPIWFEDLAEADKYDKPVILTFDDGYRDNYTDLFPLLQKYNVKATVFVITGWLGGDKYLTPEQVTEMSGSGLVSIQSHTYSHKDLDSCDRDMHIEQMSQSKLQILKLTGKEPFVLCYPRGRQSSLTLELLPDYYNFGVKMNGSAYCTGDDQSLVHRYYVRRGMNKDSFARMLGK